jgi:hypothetical protein
MYNCKRVTYLASESIDRKLPLFQRMGVRMHFMMCKFCLRYQEQLLFLRKTARLYSESSEDSDTPVKLSPTVGKRIKESMIRSMKTHE